MIEKNKPTILISKCIEHEACRYDGKIIRNEFIRKLKNYVDFIPICPEMEIGLSCPREVLRIVEDKNIRYLVNSGTGEDYTEKVISFSNELIRNIKEKNINGIILKSKSPSCGIKDSKVYKDFGKIPPLPKKSSGIFAQRMIDEFNDVPIESEGRLLNSDIKEHFLTRVFTSFNFENMAKEKSIKSIIDFQSNYKYLLMQYSPSKQKELGRIVANINKDTIEGDLKIYNNILSKALANKSNSGKNINMLLHLFGYFSDDLSQEEKAFFLDRIKMYQECKVPFCVPLNIIRSWVIRFNNKYLLGQKIFDVFPIDLIEIND